MNKYLVTIALITGYVWNPILEEYDTNCPQLKNVEFEVEAENEGQAIVLAQRLETSQYCVWEYYTEQLD